VAGSADSGSRRSSRGPGSRSAVPGYRDYGSGDSTQRLDSQEGDEEESVSDNQVWILSIYVRASKRVARKNTTLSNDGLP